MLLIEKKKKVKENIWTVDVCLCLVNLLSESDNCQHQQAQWRRIKKKEEEWRGIKRNKEEQTSHKMDQVKKTQTTTKVF